jgi:hypothetical protein
MNEKEQSNFAGLKKLLKFKRHEVPPPGYFNNFSSQVISRIRAGEAGGSRTFMERLEAEAPWLVNFVRVFETRPGLLGGLATSLCVLLLLAAVFADRPDAASKNLLSVSEPSAASGSSVVASMSEPPQLTASSDSSGIVASTNPVTSLQPTATLFGQTGGSPLFQPAGFMPAGN